MLRDDIDTIDDFRNQLDQFQPQERRGISDGAPGESNLLKF